jgi:hypothetical protein
MNDVSKELQGRKSAEQETREQEVPICSHKGYMALYPRKWQHSKECLYLYKKVSLSLCLTKHYAMKTYGGIDA